MKRKSRARPRLLRQPSEKEVESLGTSQGYWYYRGELRRVAFMHNCEVDSVDTEVQRGSVRIRDHQHKVCFQGRSRQLVLKAAREFAEHIRPLKQVSLEWPGHFVEGDYVRDILF